MRATLKVALIAALSLQLTACVTVGPDYTSPEPISKSSWGDAQLSDEFIKIKKVESTEYWWKALNDATLTSLIEQALQSSPDTQSMLAKLRESRARLGVAKSSYYPSLNIDGSSTESTSSKQLSDGSTSQYHQYGFDASWEIDLFGGVRRGVEAANADYQAIEAEAEDVQIILASEVASQYADYRNAQTRLSIANSNLKSQKSTLELTSWRAEAGLASSLDVEQANTNFQETRARVPLIELEKVVAANRLAVLLGKQPGELDALLKSTVSTIKIPSSLVLNIPAEQLRQRPDVRYAERTLAAETARIGEATAALYPSFSIGGSIGLESLTFSGLGDTGAKNSSVLAGLTIPLFNGGALRNAVDAQTAVRDQALIAYRQTVLTAVEEIENALKSLSSNQKRTKALQEAVESARNSVLLAKQQYEAGLIDFQTVLTTERSQLTTEDSLATSKNNTLTSLITLYKALGGGWANAQINALHTSKNSL